MSERWRKREFPKDVIGDERLPFSRPEKRFDVALQKRGGDGHARSPFRAETTPIAPSSTSLLESSPGKFKLTHYPRPQNRWIDVPASVVARATSDAGDRGPQRL